MSERYSNVNVEKVKKRQFIAAQKPDRDKFSSSGNRLYVAWDMNLANREYSSNIHEHKHHIDMSSKSYLQLPIRSDRFVSFHYSLLKNRFRYSCDVWALKVAAVASTHSKQQAVIALNKIRYTISSNGIN